MHAGSPDFPRRMYTAAGNFGESGTPENPETGISGDFGDTP